MNWDTSILLVSSNDGLSSGGHTMMSSVVYNAHLNANDALSRLSDMVFDNPIMSFSSMLLVADVNPPNSSM